MNNKRKLLVLVGLLVISLPYFSGRALNVHAQSGQDWTKPINLSNSGSAYNPFLVVDETGAFHAIWFDLFDGYKYAESTDGLTWTEPRSVNFPFSPKKTISPEKTPTDPAFSIEEIPQLLFVLGPRSEVYVFWQDGKRTLYYSRADSANLGSSTGWEKALKLSDSVMNFDVVVDTKGQVHLSYLRSLDTNIAPAGIYYRQFDGLQWLTTTNLYTSQYFRSITPDDAHVRIAVSADTASIYVAWDDPFQKQILMSKSINDGRTWQDTSSVVTLDPGLGLNTPHNVEINTMGGAVLLLWQMGDPKINCTQFSQWSVDGGNQWGEPIRMFEGFGACSQQADFLLTDENFSLVLLRYQDNLSMIAWNGREWSVPQPQEELYQFVNDTTQNPIVFGCQQVAIQKNMAAIVGCDNQFSKDVWFTTRALESFDAWFPPASAWGSEIDVTATSQALSSVASITDLKNNIHVVWVQSASSTEDPYKPRIQYTLWNGTKWSEPISIFSQLDDVPLALSLAVDSHGRLFITWVNEFSGDLMFSWSNADRAGNPLEWKQPVVLPSLSKLNGAPDILVDSSGKIVVIYAVEINENRGVYMVQSVDSGESWSPPRIIFDAALAGWDVVGQAQITLSADGRLHLLFAQDSYRADGESGLYYSQSRDGGVSWSAPVLVNRAPVQWVDILSYMDNVVHLFWQTNDSVTSTFHQVSRDGGEVWDAPTRISNGTGKTSKPAVAIDWLGGLHLLQVVSSDAEDEILREWEWLNRGWTPVETKPLNIPGKDIQISIDAEVTSSGRLHSLVLLGFLPIDDQVENRLADLSRSLNLTGNPTVNPAMLPTSVNIVSPTLISNPQIIQSAEPSLTALEDSPSQTTRSLVGFLLVIIVVALVLFLIMPRPKNPTGPK